MVKFPNSGPPLVGPHGYMKLGSNSDSGSLMRENEGSKKSNNDFLGVVDRETVQRGLGRSKRVGGGGKQPLPHKICTNRKRAH